MHYMGTATAVVRERSSVVFDFDDAHRPSVPRASLLTTVVAVIIHVALVGAIVLTTLFATDVVDVPDSIDAVIISAPPPPPPPPPPAAAAAPKTESRPQPAKVVQPVAPRPAPTPQSLPQVTAAPVQALPEATASGSATGSPVPVGTYGVEKGVPGGTSGGTIGGVVTPSAPPPPPPPKEPPAPKGPVRVGGKISAPQVVHRVNPDYPAVAQQARVGGDVVLEAVVGPDGRVQSVRVVKSHPLLEQAAVNAVKQWRYEPLRLNGEPTPFVLSVTVAFTVR